MNPTNYADDRPTNYAPGYPEDQPTIDAIRMDQAILYNQQAYDKSQPKKKIFGFVVFIVLLIGAIVIIWHFTKSKDSNNQIETTDPKTSVTGGIAAEVLPINSNTVPITSSEVIPPSNTAQLDPTYVSKPSTTSTATSDPTYVNPSNSVTPKPPVATPISTVPGMFSDLNSVIQKPILTNAITQPPTATNIKSVSSSTAVLAPQVATTNQTTQTMTSTTAPTNQTTPTMPINTKAPTTTTVTPTKILSISRAPVFTAAPTTTPILTTTTTATTAAKSPSTVTAPQAVPTTVTTPTTTPKLFRGVKYIHISRTTSGAKPADEDEHWRTLQVAEVHAYDARGNKLSRVYFGPITSNKFLTGQDGAKAIDDKRATHAHTAGNDAFQWIKFELRGDPKNTKSTVDLSRVLVLNRQDKYPHRLRGAVLQLLNADGILIPPMFTLTDKLNTHHLLPR